MHPLVLPMWFCRPQSPTFGENASNATNMIGKWAIPKSSLPSFPSYFCFSFVSVVLLLCFDIRSQVAQAGLEHPIFLPLPPKCGTKGVRHQLPGSFYVSVSLLGGWFCPM